MAAMLLAVAATTVGCTGSARVNFVSLNMTAIDPPPARAWEFDAGECYWWLDESGDLNLALRSVRHDALLGKFGRVELCVSLSLDAPPAGSGRNYTIRQREVRAVATTTLQSHRFTSYAGIVGVSTQRPDRYSGSFRIWLNAHTELSLFTVMPNRPGTVLCFGRFEAVHDEARGKAIRLQTEAGGYVRPGKPRTFGAAATRPVLQPTTQPPPAAASQPAAGRE
jgi:hypothetical protein